MVICYNESSRYSFDKIKEFVSQLNSICDALAGGQYVEGSRNNIAVDLSCCCHAVGLDPMEVADMAWADVDDPDRDDLERRVKVIFDYVDFWDDSGDISQYMVCSWGEPEKEWFTLV